MRVASNYLHTTMLHRMQQANVDISKTAAQISSGLKAQRFEDISSEANTLLSLQDLKLNTDQYIKNMKTANGRLKASENALQGMMDLVVEAANLWTLGRNENSPEARASLAPKAEGLTRSFFSLLQTEFEGRFVFSGMAGEQTPINVAPTANIFPGDPPPTTYYTGDTQRTIVITNPATSQEYGVTGDHMGFARMKAGLESLWNGLQTNNIGDIDGAIDLLNQAQEDLSGLLGEVGGQQSGFDLLITRHENANLFLTERVDDIEKVDIAEAMTRFSQEQAMLESSLVLIQRMNSISLLDFLR